MHRHAGARVGFQMVEYQAIEQEGITRVCVNLFVGNLGTSVEVTLTTEEGTATGSFVIMKHNILKLGRIKYNTQYYPPTGAQY